MATKNNPEPPPISLETEQENETISEETMTPTKRVTTDLEDDTKSALEKHSKKQKTTDVEEETGAATTATQANGARDENGESEEKDPKELNTDVVTKDDRPLAKQYPFELDSFQKQSIQYLERNESVLVAAHTSAGKTAVAEYAIAMALNEKQRVIYTSPIKALSNQKFRDLSEEFSDVGLLTGDVTINPNASCLVMTTEILRSMLYRGSEIIREVAWAIFDEVHYMKDKTRGVVWEESIILLPHKVRYVFLSATIPNAKQFAGWISKVHNQPCHVVYTNYRPTPLQHYIYPSNGDGIHLIVDEKGNFKDDNLQRAMAVLGRSALEEELLAENTSRSNSRTARRKRTNRHSNKQADLLRVLKMVTDKNFGPCIVFSFSKKDCEKYAKRVSRFELSLPEEAELVEEVFWNAIDALKEEDKQLPQIMSLLPLLKRGIGIHHGGLLPILKEIVEILFGEGLLKVLFATETFAMGVNMPAKTVIFTAMKKFDGTEIRWVHSGEYIQMSGRAGRRGLDAKGIVIQMVDDILPPDTAKQIMSGEASPLSSTFYLGYNMLLNLYRIEDSNPEYIISNSLFAYQQELELPELEEQVKQRKEQVEGIELAVDMEGKLVQYHGLLLQLNRLKDDLRAIVMQPKYLRGFISEGRLVKLHRTGAMNWWGIVVEVKERRLKQEKRTTLSLTVVAPCEDEERLKLNGGSLRSALKLSEVKPFKDVKESVPKFITVSTEELDAVGTIRMKSNTFMSKKLPVLKSLLRNMFERFPEGIPVLDPFEDMKIEEEQLKDIMKEAEKVQQALVDNEIQKLSPEEREKLYGIYMEKYNLNAEIKLLEREVKKVKSLPMKDKLKRMKIVLRRLGHLDKENVIQLKGRVACEISTAHELVITEMLLSGTLYNTSPEVAAALLSCVVYTERGEDDIQLPPDLKGALGKLKKVATKVAEVEKDAGLDTTVEEFVEQFKPDIMEAVYMWCTGKKFVEVMEVTGVFEGNFIRCVRRLAELLRQLVSATKVIGDTNLEQMFRKAIEKMKRDIIFAGSLYLQE